MRSLVTGATGFIGSHVAEILKGMGHDVRLLVRDERRLFPELKTGYEIARGDVTNKPHDLQKHVEGCDYVFHVAGLIKGRTQREFNEVNAFGVKHLCEAVKLNKQSIKRFLLVSSLAAIGPAEDSRHAVHEDDTPHPQTYYGRSKLLGEKFAHMYEPEMPLTIVRPPAVYGPRDTGILEFFKFMSKGYAMQLGSEERAFSMIHGKDLARGIIEAAMHENTVGEAFFLTDPKPYAMSWTMALLRDILKPTKHRTLSAPIWVAKLYARFNDVLQLVTGTPRLPNSDKMRELLPLYWVCSGEKAKKTFGFAPKIRIHEGMKETAEFYIQKGWIKVE
ncbi:MAG: NAD(P)-dependent oxidoreductase [Planctomycetes bacterium]|nr:NAD(P)-dependent oxidoreductase [Planctomycetota bacterium]